MPGGTIIENLKQQGKNWELEQLEASSKQKEQELREAESKLAEIEAAGDIKSIKKLIKENPVKGRAQVELKVPYKKFEYGGFTILVGQRCKERMMN